MKQIKYGDSSFALRCEFSDDWNMESLTGLNITIKDNSNNDLVAATAATLYTATTLNAAASAGDEYITMAGGASAVSPGDRLYIAKSNSGPGELIVVHSYDAANKYVYTQDELRYAHANGTAVKGMFATYAFDVSDTDTYTKGKQIVVIWTPNTDDIAYTDRYVIGAVSEAMPGFWQDFAAMYPSEYELVSGRELSSIEEQIKERFRHEFTSRNMDISRIVDQTRLTPGMVLFARYLLISSERVDNDFYMRARSEWVDWFKILCEDPIWQDHDQDGSEDDAEVQTHGLEFVKRYL